ncbi:dihydropteroate synthase [Haloarcula taiwanensis]|uniref:Dihydropteroate synthase n=1 Tax=Haloarcula taiwanensis TaxID=1932004 RepID=A0A2H4ZWM9_9EURY|nr:MULTISPECIES: dihydropteroate synthase [Haloarcula]AUG46878.1 dihydropteroate synthase [Haloarcula taiwanensis]RLM37082.1 dihydropteroate synthase [Haloarcula sp. Atlit-120R]RLM44528.1 dihydropteroate synthase [Haloarcula sp. Atlit-47R]
MRTVEIDGLPVGDGHPTRVMSVLNMSSNSGYKPSVYLDPAEAADAIEENLVPAGADIIDVGLQSANPKYESKPVEMEKDRLEEVAPLVDELDADVPLSLETRYAEVAEEAIGHGFDLINDVCGFADPEMKGVVEDHDMPVVKMASPPDLSRPGALKTIDDIFEALQRDGFTDRTIIDPAFGGWYDGKEFEDNWEMFRRLREFRAFDRPMLTATNREDFLGDLADQPETENQLAVSLAAATMEVERGAHIIRTHDTQETHDVVKVADALGDERTTRAETDSGPTVSELTDVSLREVARHQALGETVAGGTDNGATLTFLLGDLTDDARSSIRAVAEVTDVVVVEKDSGSLYVGGAAAALKVVTDSLAEDGHRELAGELRASLSRRV